MINMKIKEEMDKGGNNFWLKRRLETLIYQKILRMYEITADKSKLIFQHKVSLAINISVTLMS